MNEHNKPTCRALLFILLGLTIFMSACTQFITEPPPVQTEPTPTQNQQAAHDEEPDNDIVPSMEGHTSSYIISIAWATPDTIVVTSGAIVTDFTFFSLGFCDVDIFFYVDEIIYTQAELLPEQPFYAQWQPDMGISFVDHHNRRRYFIVMYDAGAEYLTLVEFEPGVNIASG